MPSWVENLPSWVLVVVWAALGFSLLAIAFSSSWGTMRGANSLLDPPKRPAMRHEPTLAPLVRDQPPAEVKDTDGEAPAEEHDDDGSDGPEVGAQETIVQGGEVIVRPCPHPEAHERDSHGDKVESVHDRGAHQR